MAKLLEFMLLQRPRSGTRVHLGIQNDQRKLPPAALEISPDLLDKPLIHQYFRTIAEPPTEVNLHFSHQSVSQLWQKARTDSVAAAQVRRLAHPAGAGRKLRTLGLSI